MNKIQEAKIAFKLWENITHLETSLWDLYCKKFLQLMIEQDNTEKSKQETQEFIF